MAGNLITYVNYFLNAIINKSLLKCVPIKYIFPIKKSTCFASEIPLRVIIFL